MTYSGIIVIIFVICVSIVLFNLFNSEYDSQENEHYSGALTQLYAKGAQDSYLYGDVWKYNDPYWYLWPEHYNQYLHGYYIGKYPYYQYEFNHKTYRDW